MQYLVEGARGPLPPSPELAIALLEGTVIPHFEYLIRLKAEGKMLAGGVPVGDRAFVCIIEAASNDRDRIAGLLYDVRKGEVGRAQALAKLRKHFELATITFPPVPPPPAAP